MAFIYNKAFKNFLLINKARFKNEKKIQKEE